MPEGPLKRAFHSCAPAGLLHDHGTTTMNATSAVATQCGVGVPPYLSVRTPNVPAGHLAAASGSAVLNPADRENSAVATHDFCSGLSDTLGWRQ